MSLSFAVDDTSMSQLWDYGWFDLTRFSVTGGSAEHHDPPHIFRAFLQDPVSQRSFCDPGPWGERVARHGPFPHEAPIADWLHRLTPDELRQRVQAALEDPEFTEPPSREQRHAVETWVDLVTTRGDALYAVEAPDAPGVRVTWAFVWLVYHEFLTLRADSRELTAAVIGYD
jgi:hypothetical protein